MATKSDFIVRSGLTVSSNATVNGALIVGATNPTVTNSSGIWSISSNSAAYVNSTNYTGTSNNAVYLGGVAYNYYIANTDSRTLSGNLVFSGANNGFTGANLLVTGTNLNVSSNALFSGNASFSGITTFSGIVNHTANLGINTYSPVYPIDAPTSTIRANTVITNYLAANGTGNTGTAGYVLVSGGNAANAYWASLPTIPGAAQVSLYNVYQDSNGNLYLDEQASNANIAASNTVSGSYNQMFMGKGGMTANIGSDGYFSLTF